MAAPAFTLNRAEVVDRNFLAFCERAGGPFGGIPRRPFEEPSDTDPEITGRELRELFESQILSRQLDLEARRLRRQNRGFYTIGSSGHEGNVVLGRCLRYNDPAFLHYRSGALVAERARQVPAVDPVRDTLLSFMAAADDPISGGRHKVWGSVPLCIPPQTSTIASHLPRAVGAAMALERGRKLQLKRIFGDHGELPADAIVLCNFGDATTNHSVAQGAFNACSYAAYQNLPVPILFVCEDNGIGISVHSAAGWIEANFRGRPSLRYFQADGLNLLAALRVARQAADFVRAHRRPAFLHLKVVRLMGHAGTDPETEYHTIQQIEADEARDPLLSSARIMIENGWMSASDVRDLYELCRTRVQALAHTLGEPRKLTSAAEIVAPLAPYRPDAVLAEARRKPDQTTRLHAFALDSTPGFLKHSDKPRLPEFQPPRHLAVLINWALRDLLAKYPEMSIFGEDVAARGGVYYVTAGLTARFGLGRVFNTLLDETSILGMAIGAGHLGMLPVPEIQYLAYVHNAIDQLRGEACSSSFFSNGQFPNPMVVRIQSLGYQKGFGGHFHNDNSIAALRDIPGLVIAVPARGDDAARMLRTCTALAKVNGRVVAFLEPIALYMTKDLCEPNDGQWLSTYPVPDEVIPLGEGKVYHEEARDLTILTYGNGLHMSLRAARVLRETHRLAARVVDLRWLNPLNEALIVEQSAATGRVLVVDEGRFSGGVHEAILALLQERSGDRVVAHRLTGHDTYVPLGPAANLVLPTEGDVVSTALKLVSGSAEAGQASRVNIASMG